LKKRVSREESKYFIRFPENPWLVIGSCPFDPFLSQANLSEALP